MISLPPRRKTMSDTIPPLPDTIRHKVLIACIKNLAIEYTWPVVLAAIRDAGSELSSRTVVAAAQSAIDEFARHQVGTAHAENTAETPSGLTS